MSMRVELQSLVPSVQHTEEADLRAQMTWVTGHFEQRLGTGVKQQVEDRLFVLQGQRRQLARQSEYGMHIASRQKFRFPRVEPAQASVALTPWTMPIATRVIRDGDVAAV
jgi:hypothetical protein